MISTRPLATVPRSSPPAPDGDRAEEANPGEFFGGVFEVLIGFVAGVIVGVAAIVFVLTQGLRPPTRDPSWRMALSVLAGIVILGVLTLGVGFPVAGPVAGTVVWSTIANDRSREFPLARAGGRV